MQEELKKVEDRLKESEERYRRLFETARDGILLLNSTTGEIEDVNPFLEQLLGYTREEFLGKMVWDVGAFKNIKESKKVFKTIQETGYARYENLPLETKDGRLIDVGFVSNAYMVGDKRVIQCNIRDISERKKADASEKAIFVQKEEKSKTSFIADITHELRTPLAIIKGNVDLALRDKRTVQIETFQAINTEINHLAEMLSNLTILTTDNQELYLKIEKHVVNLQKLILDVVERLQILAATKNISLNIKGMPSVDISGNKTYLEKLFSNVINNGIFYGKENGTVTIEGKQTDTQIIITVTDDGIGISEEDLPNVFDRFYRAVNARDVNHAGTGLGLAISKWIVDSHNGNIIPTSILNKGTTFTITFPLA